MRYVLYLLAAAGLLILLLKWQERLTVFAPSREVFTDPGRAGLPFEEVYLEADGNRLHGWYVPGQSSTTVLWLHGNAGNIADRVDHLAAMSRELGVSHLLFDYRGYGRSSGGPSEKGIYRDAAAAWQYLTVNRGIDPGRIVIYGHSLGAAVAVHLTGRTAADAGAVVLESPFTSAADMARLIYHRLPMHLLLSVRFDNMCRVGDLRPPLLVIHGEEDTVIPFAMGQRVFAAATGRKTFLAVPGGDHSDCYLVGGDAYWKAWRDLIR